MQITALRARQEITWVEEVKSNEDVVQLGIGKSKLFRVGS